MTRLVIRLHAHNQASCGRHVVVRSKSDPIPALCRKLIEDGAPPETEVVVKRGSTVCFLRPRTLAEWSAVTVRDDDNRGLVVEPYRPMPALPGRTRGEKTAYPGEEAAE